MTTMLEAIRGALSYAAEDLRERANFEEKHRTDGDPEPDSEEAEYIYAADQYSAALTQLDALPADRRPIWLNEEVQA